MNETATNLGDLLKGCRLILDLEGNPIVQSIRNMEVAFLTTDDEFVQNQFGNPLDTIFSNKGYGHLKAENRSDAPVVLPAQIAVFERGAQNHAMTKAAFLRAMGIKEFDDAGCVEGSQGGYLRGRNTTIRFVPLLMREALLRDAFAGVSGDYGHAYPYIEQLGKTVGINTGSYLNVFFDKFKDDIETFIAHFERPPRCIGVIVLVGGEIVAIDKWPNFNYAEWLWDMVVRDCYGSLAIALQRNTEDKSSVKINAHVPKINGESTADFLMRCVNDALKMRNDKVLEAVLALENETFAQKLDSDSDADVKSYILDSHKYMGQLITDGVWYFSVSLVLKGLNTPETLQNMSQSKRLAREIARRQAKFTAQQA